MPLLQLENFYHIYNRGNNKQPIFYDEKDYFYFLKKVQKAFSSVEIISWCLMPNHFHVLIYTVENKNLTNFNLSLGNLLSSYTQVFNSKYERSGSLFQQRTKFKLLDYKSESYPLICFNYIHQNPMKAGLVDKMENYTFSSFRDYTGFRNGKLCNKLLAKELLNLPNDAKEIYNLSYSLIPENDIKMIF